METDFPYEIILYLYHIPPVPNIVIFRKSVTYDEKLRNFLFPHNLGCLWVSMIFEKKEVLKRSVWGILTER